MNDSDTEYDEAEAPDESESWIAEQARLVVLEDGWA